MRPTLEAPESAREMNPGEFRSCVRIKRGLLAYDFNISLRPNVTTRLNLPSVIATLCDALSRR